MPGEHARSCTKSSMIIYRAHWTQFLDGCTPNNCMIHESVVVAESRERVKQLIYKKYGASFIGKITKIGEVTEDSSAEFHREGFFFTESQYQRLDTRRFID